MAQTTHPIARLAAPIAAFGAFTALALPAAAQPSPQILQPAPAPRVAASSCEALAPDGTATAIGCRLTLSRDAADRPVVVRILLSPPARPCAAAKVIELGPSRPAALPQVDEGASKSSRTCQP